MHFKFETSSTSGESMKISLLVKGEHLGFFFLAGEKLGPLTLAISLIIKINKNSQLFGLFSHCLGGKYSPVDLSDKEAATETSFTLIKFCTELL